TTKTDGTYPVSANPGSGYVFDHWTTSGGVSVSSANSQSTTATVTGTGSIKAWFTQPMRTITFYTDPTAGGTITFAGSTYSNGQSTTKTDGTYPVSANPGSGYVFDHWTTSGGVSVSNANSQSTTATVTGTGSIKAWFTQPMRTITFYTDPTAGGTITFAGSTYSNGQTTTKTDGADPVSANPPSGYVFDHWSTSGGVSVSNANSQSTTATVSGTGSIKAWFTTGPQHTITFYTDPPAGGTITFDGTTYSNGQSTTRPDGSYPLYANPAPNCLFDYWSTTGGVSVPNPNSQSTTVTVSGDGSINARLECYGQGVLYLDPSDSSAPYCDTKEVQIRVNTEDDGVWMNGGSIVLTYESGCADVTNVVFDPMWSVTAWDSETPGQETVGFLIPAEDLSPDNYLVATLTIHCVNDSLEGCITDLAFAEGTILTNVAGQEIYPELEHGTFECMPCTCGDTNCDVDHRVNIADASLLFSHVILGYPICCEGCAEWCGNVNCVGGVNIADASLLFSHVILGYPIECCPTELALKASSSSGSGELYLDPSDSSASYCDTAEVQIRVNTGDDGVWINGGSIVLTYESGCANVTNVVFDPMWSVKAWNSETPGQETLGFLIPAEDLSPDDYLVATLTIHCVNDSLDGCVTDLVFAEGTILTNIAGEEIYPQTEDGTFRCMAPFTLTVTSDGCCLIDVSYEGFSGEVLPYETELFEIPCGTNITLTADDSEEGCNFIEWAVDGEPVSGNPIDVTMDSDHTAIATCYGDGVTMVSIDAPDEVAEGSDFIANVTVDYVENYNSCGFDVTYDQSIITVTDVTDGEIDGHTVEVGPGDWTYIPPGPDPGKIRVIAQMGGMPGPGVTGTGYIAQIHYHVLGSVCNTSNIHLENLAMYDYQAKKIPTTTRDDMVTVGVSLVITTTGLPDGEVGNIYSATLEATGGVTPYTWEAPGLPAGLTCSGAGVISGTPVGEVGDFSVTVTVTGALGNTDEEVLSLTISCKLGDANMDGVVDTGDITKVKRIYFGIDPPTDCADINGDGKIDTGDITAIKIIYFS
ncbi:MAG: cohesin domain-containing protein, partial [Dehalococcoidia bacterium]